MLASQHCEDPLLAFSGRETPRVLIVEDDQILAMALQAGVQDCGCSVSGVAASASEAVRLRAETRPHLVLMDVRLQGSLDGIAAANLIRAESDVPIVFQTAHGDSHTVARIQAAGAAGLLMKPFSLEELRQEIRRVLNSRQVN